MANKCYNNVDDVLSFIEIFCMVEVAPTTCPSGFLGGLRGCIYNFFIIMLLLLLLAEQQPMGRWVELKQEPVSPSSD